MSTCHDLLSVANRLVGLAGRLYSIIISREQKLKEKVDVALVICGRNEALHCCRHCMRCAFTSKIRRIGPIY